MKYIVVIFWSLVLGMVLGFITSSLESQTFNVPVTAVVSVIIGLSSSIIITAISKEKTDQPK
ncbi:MAG: YjzD family protein [Lactobacillaceae bacterium]|nr:YjzD family protein [Lactobacillaceae bacterium]